MNILVTGSNGFVGKHTIKILSKNKKYSIRCLSHEAIDNDCEMERALSGTDIVVHLAGVNRSDSPYTVYNGNVIYTLQIIENMKQYAPRAKIIYASSLQVYEKDSFYGMTKLHAESIIRWHSRLFGIPAIILRFSNIYGPFCKPFYNSVIATFLYQAMNGQTLVINGKGDQKRDFLYVSDAVSAIQKAMDYTYTNGSITSDIRSGTTSTIGHIVTLIRTYSLRPVKTDYKKGSKETQGECREGIHPVYVNMGWSTRISLEEGIQNILREEYGIVRKKT